MARRVPTRWCRWSKDKIITQPFGDRSKVVIEPMLTDQWFVDTAKIVGPALDAVRDGRTTIVPRAAPQGLFPLAGEHRALDDLAPAVVGAPDPGLVRLRPGRPRLPRRRGRRRARRGGDAAASERPDAAGGRGPAPLRGGFRRRRGPVRRRAGPVAHAAEPCARGGGRRPARGGARLGACLAQYEIDQDPTKLVYPVWRDPDVLDTWFSSGLWPIGTLGWPEETER
jgi:valyl-tRNA synthetase